MRRHLTSIILLLIVLCCQACSGPPKVVAPKVFPVKGKVVQASGEPLPGGLVEFRSQTNETWKATGVINPEGEFTLKAFVGNKQIEGTIAGPHVVVVMPPLGQSQGVQANAMPVTIAETYTVNEEGENFFQINLPAN